MSDVRQLRRRFRQLHEGGLFVMPNAWDVGSARLLSALGFPAIATTSSGHAASLGQADQTVTLAQLAAHVEQLVAGLGVPLNVDAERCFADDPPGVAATVVAIAELGPAGISIEDYDPATARVDPVGDAVERVGAAAEAAHRHDMVLTARAENHLYGIEDLEDTIGRLRAYRAAGADVVYAPGLIGPDAVRVVVEATDAPVNVLAMRKTPAIAVLAQLGVRRVSTGGGLARAAYGALRAAADELLRDGTSSYLDAAIGSDELEAMLSGRYTETRTFADMERH